MRGSLGGGSRRVGLTGSLSARAVLFLSVQGRVRGSVGGVGAWAGPGLTGQPVHRGCAVPLQAGAEGSTVAAVLPGLGRAGKTQDGLSGQKEVRGLKAREGGEG